MIMDILLMLPGFILSLILTVVYERELRKSQNKVHFYVARDKNGDIYLYLGKPRRCSYNFVNLYGALGTFANEYHFKDFGINPDDFKNLKWEDKPVEVFLNLED